MNKMHTILWLSALWCGAGAALAQTPSPNAPGAAPPPAKASAQSEAGEPRANGGKPTAQSEAGEPRADAPGAVAPGAVAPAPRANTAGKPKPPASPPPNPAPTAAAAPGAQKGANKVDRLELSTATVTGDREQPKVMYIVPWKKSDIGDLEGKPMNSLVDEILSPVDRDVFRREVRYYQTVKPDGSQNGARPPAGQGEK
jgi:hypothetical protein